jgi:acetyltransferase-like isoleucine patch superfamily enzyme
VKIGEGAVIAAFSVVTGDIRPYATVMGNPAREVGRRFADDVIESLMLIDWASWPAATIATELEHLTGAKTSDVIPALAGPKENGREAVLQVSTRESSGVGSVRRFTGRALRALARVVNPEQQPTRPASDAAAGIVTMGRASYYVPMVHADSSTAGRVTIGSYTSIAQGCEIFMDPKHVLRTELPSLAPASHHPADTKAAPTVGVSIGSDVWVGTGAKIFPGVTIGDGAVVAAWSVVTADIAPFAIVGGNPAREKRRRFEQHIVEALLRIRWWDWPEDVVTSRWRELCSPDVAGFVTRHDPLSTGH